MNLYSTIPNSLGNTLLLLNIEHLSQDIQLHEPAISFSLALVLVIEALSKLLQLGQIAETQLIPQYLVSASSK